MTQPHYLQPEGNKVTQADLDKAKAYVGAVERSAAHLPAHRYTKLLALATEQYELLIDRYTAEFCESGNGR